MIREYPIRQKNLEERFWSKVKILDSNSCWEWMASKVNKEDAYGGFFLNGRCRRAHRIAYELTYNVKLDTKQFVCHTCDNPSCVNPKHLWVGTNSDNMQDSIRKGRHSRMWDSNYNPRKNLTHCPKGHIFDKKNTYRSPDGKRRSCRTCKNRWMKDRYWAKKREQIIHNAAIDEVLKKLKGEK